MKNQVKLWDFEDFFLIRERLSHFSICKGVLGIRAYSARSPSSILSKECAISGFLRIIFCLRNLVSFFHRKRAFGSSEVYRGRRPDNYTTIRTHLSTVKLHKNKPTFLWVFGYNYSISTLLIKSRKRVTVSCVCLSSSPSSSQRL